MSRPRADRQPQLQEPAQPLVTHIAGDDAEAFASVLVLLWDRRQKRLKQQQSQKNGAARVADPRSPVKVP